MDKLAEAIKEITERYLKENDNKKMEEGDNVAAVYKDCVIILEMKENRELAINIISGEPYRYNKKVLQDILK